LNLFLYAFILKVASSKIDWGKLQFLRLPWVDLMFREYYIGYINYYNQYI